MGLDERFDALRRTGPPVADVDTEAALVVVARRAGRPARRRVGFLLVGAVAAVLLLVVGIVAVQGEDDLAVVAGEGSDRSATDATPPVDPGPARLWLSATEVPVTGADVAAVILWDGDGETPMWGVPATLDRWTGEQWDEQFTFTFCPDFWGCSGELAPAQGWADLGVGPDQALWVRVEGLEVGTYRMRAVANDGVVAAGQFDVVDRAVDLPPAEHSVEVAGSVGSAMRLTVRPAVWAAFDELDLSGSRPYLDMELEVVDAGPTDDWFPSSSQTARYERWAESTWVEVEEVPLMSDPPLSVSVSNSVMSAGDYRVVIERSGGEPLVGRFWVRDAADLEISPRAEESGSSASPSSTTQANIDGVLGVATPLGIPADPEIRLDPAGPVADGSTVVLSVPAGYTQDWWNDRPRLCVAAPEGVSCDPVGLAVPSQPVTGDDRDTIEVVLRREVLTPAGWRDCATADVDCRLVVRHRSGREVASPRLAFDGDVADRPTLEVEALGSGRFRVTPDGLPEGPVSARVCGFRATSLPDAPPGQTATEAWGLPQVAPLGISNCATPVWGLDQQVTVTPDRPFTVTVPREIYGYWGWTDCAVGGCALVVDSQEGTSVAAVLPFDESDPLPARPSIRIVEPSPYRPGQEITVVLADLLPDSGDLVGVCRVGAGWACGYETSTAGSGDRTVRLRLRDDTASCSADGCYLEVDSGSEGLAPPAIVPLPVEP